MDGKIFISYRRDDEAFFAEQLYERLKQKYTKERVFYDVENIPAGRNFVRELQDQVEKCDVLLAIIGREWLDARDEAGTRRLDKADDFVRIEIELALAQNKLVIPVLVGNTRVPRAEMLPDPLKPLVHLQAYQFNHGRFIADLKGFESVLDTVLAEIRERKETPATSPEKLEELKELHNWEFIKSSDNPDEFRKHLALYPNGSTVRYAKAALEKAAWKALGGDPTLEQMRVFLAEFPDGHYYKRAAQLRDGLHSKFAEETRVLEEVTAWNEALGANTVPSFEKFLASFPASAHSMDARAGIERIEESERAETYRKREAEAWAKAVAADTAFAYENFLKAWPHGLHRWTAKARLRDLREPARWKEHLSRRNLIVGGGVLATGAAALLARYAYVASSGAPIILRGHTGGLTVRSVAFSPDGQHIATASIDATARLWKASTGALIAVLTGHLSSVWSTAFSPQGRRLVTASNDKSARIWDVFDGRTIAELKGHEGGVGSAVFSPDGDNVLTTSADKTARLWDGGSGALLVKLTGHEGVVWSAGFSPDGMRVVTSDDKSPRLWDVASGKQLTKFAGAGIPVWSVSFSPDGKRVIGACRDGAVRVWDARTGAVVATLKGHTAAISTVAFSSSGPSVVTASVDGTARLWDANTGAELKRMSGHTKGLFSAVFSPDRSRIATASADNTARLWDAKTGNQITALSGHQDQVSSAVFSPDGSLLATGSFDKTARIWRV